MKTPKFTVATTESSYAGMESGIKNRDMDDGRILEGRKRRRSRQTDRVMIGRENCRSAERQIGLGGRERSKLISKG